MLLYKFEGVFQGSFERTFQQDKIGGENDIKDRKDMEAARKDAKTNQARAKEKSKDLMITLMRTGPAEADLPKDVVRGWTAVGEELGSAYAIRRYGVGE